MKKSTLLLAVLGTVAGAASAQSSVTHVRRRRPEHALREQRRRHLPAGPGRHGRQPAGLSRCRRPRRRPEGQLLARRRSRPGHRSRRRQLRQRRRAAHQRLRVPAPFNGEPVQPVGRDPPGARLHADLLEHRRLRPLRPAGCRFVRQHLPVGGDPRHCRRRRRLRHAGARQQLGAVHPAERRLRPRPVRPGDGGGRRSRPGQQVLRRAHRLCRRPVRRGRGLRHYRCRRGGQRQARQLERRRLLELRHAQALGLLRLDGLERPGRR